MLSPVTQHRGPAAAVALVLGLTLVAACGDDDDDATPAATDTPTATATPSATATADPQAELHDALEAVSPVDLSIMPLPAEEIGVLVAGFTVDPDSGFEDAEAAAEDSLDPDDTAADFLEVGFVSGYELSYESEGLEGPVLSVRTAVRLWGSAEQARSDLERSVDVLRRAQGETIEGFRFVALEEFEVEPLGATAIGHRSTIVLGAAGPEFTQTSVIFQLGPVEGAAFIVTVGADFDVKADILRLARDLEERVRGVALAQVAGTPVPIPAAEAEGPVVPTTELERRAQAMGSAERTCRRASRSPTSALMTVLRWSSSSASSTSSACPSATPS